MKPFVLAAALALAAVAPLRAAEPVRNGTIDTAPGVSIYYEREGTGPDFVLIPGRLFMPEMRALARPNRSLILYDMRNRGKSGRVEDVGQLNVMTDVEDVEALRRHFGAGRISLVGYSYLGLMVALYASKYPERVERLVQIGPVPRRFGTPYPADQVADLATLSPEGRAAAEAWRAFRDAAGPDTPPAELCRRQAEFLSFLLVGNPANRGRVTDTCGYENESVANSTRHLEAHFADIQKRDFPRDMFTSLTMPVLTFHGTLDRNAPYGGGLEWATTFLHGRLVTVPGGAHQLWLDDPELIPDVDRFLDGAWPARALAFGRE
jgi:proline iminopeptidase